MLTLSSNVKLYLATVPTDCRKSFDGLSTLELALHMAGTVQQRESFFGVGSSGSSPTSAVVR